MVIRKPLPPTPSAQDEEQNLPYPATPTSSNSPEIDEKDVQARDSETTLPIYTKTVIPEALKAGQGRRSAERLRSDETLPIVLRSGSPGGPVKTASAGSKPSSIPNTSEETRTTTPSSNNPYSQRLQNTQPNFSNTEQSSASVWGQGDSATPPTSTSNSQTPGVSSKAQGKRPENSYTEPSSNNPWAQNDSTSALENRDASLPVSPNNDRPGLNITPATPASPDQPALIPVESEVLSPRAEEGTQWVPGVDISNIDAATSRGHGLSNAFDGYENPLHQSWDEQQAWEKAEREQRDVQAAQAAERAMVEEQERRAEEEWYQGEQEAAGKVGFQAHLPTREASQNPWEGSSGVPRPQNNEIVPEKTPRPQADTKTSTDESLKSETETPQARARKQRGETYQIKHVNWHDATAAKNPRISPILLQNANGPCPLMALVNALSLSMPDGVGSALIENLRTREQISLGLLLDSVFDELTSGRRGGLNADELPDVGDLYAFLLALHTGMNVNPRFIPPADTLTRPEIANAGTFEETREMRLYSTFNLPLIHGWLPPPSHPVFASLQRAAATYEDAQNILFHEEELEDKLRTVGLSPKEQQFLEDISTIKHFLQSSATQLTGHGLDTISRTMDSGGFAILFRNDHFSTLYKHPRSGQLMTLVTDTGYASHDEVIWESLVDVSGAGNEFFSGDFRPVGHHLAQTKKKQGQRVRSLIPDENDQDWTKVSNSRNRNNNRRSNPKPVPITTQPSRQLTASNNPFETPDNHGTLPPTTPAEQEDHDLALALQLQEEEDEAHRRELQRRNEEQLSQNFIASETGNDPPSSPRRGGRRTQEVRPLIPPRNSRNASSDDRRSTEAPPPTYEQAAAGRAFIPPPGHSAHPSSPPTSSSPSLATMNSRTSISPNTAPNMNRNSAFNANNSLYGNSEMGRGSAGSGNISGRRGSTSRATTMRENARGLINEVTNPGDGLRRRQSAGLSGMDDRHVSGGKDKECTIM